ncbi:hypothetical protein PIB30_094433 [Stylosanthes scabra]|uniref:Endonuclease/exonuclease/phosphatase domain-containing protein n=1 Tax=Stylosanthes scabra TaxID=79078 RepID=A0ABU6TXU1_9FABA|nr:hypothetical protein [Stylosanthes scabra]
MSRGFVARLWGGNDFDWVVANAEGNSGRVICAWDEMSDSEGRGKMELCEELRQLETRWHVPFMWGGDFNEILSVDDRLGCSTLSQFSSNFATRIQDMGLLELSLQGGKYTWKRPLGPLPNYGGPKGVGLGPKSFRCLDAWLSHEGFVKLIEMELQKAKGSNMVEKLAEL